METLIEIPAALEANVFGQLDEHLKKIERALNVTMVARDGTLKLIGEAADVKQAESVLMQLLELARRGNTVTEQNVNYALGMILEHRTPDLVSIDSDIICHTIQGKPVKPKTAGQKAYIDLIRKKMIVFGIGPAGTGKTYLAMAMAIEAFKRDEVSRIILIHICAFLCCSGKPLFNHILCFCTASLQTFAQHFRIRRCNKDQGHFRKTFFYLQCTLHFYLQYYINSLFQFLHNIIFGCSIIIIYIRSIFDQRTISDHLLKLFFCFEKIMNPILLTGTRIPRRC